MPKNLTPAMRAHLDEDTTQLAAIWRITRKDGAQFFFTDHDRDIVFGGDTYRADAGFARTAIRSDAGFAVDNLDLVGVFAEGGIVEDGLTAADLDVIELTDEVHGFGIARQISARGALEMLAAAYAFDAVESDHQLKFKKRGRAPSRVIPEQDLVPVNTEREAFIETRAQEVDLPAKFTVVYQELERDADIGTQYAKRVAGPTSAMHSQNEATFDLPLMLTAAEAKRIALRQLHSAWLERTGYEWRLGLDRLGDTLRYRAVGRSGELREPAPPSQWWRHGHHHVVDRNRERYDLVHDRHDIATGTPRAVPGRLLTCLEYGGGYQHQRPVRHLPLGLGLLDLAGLQRRHRADRVLRLLLDPRHGAALARRSVRLPAPTERGAGALWQCPTCDAPLDRHRRGRLPDGVASGAPAIGGAM